jgi:hypothetical protein
MWAAAYTDGFENHQDSSTRANGVTRWRDHVNSSAKTRAQPGDP